VRQQHVAPDDAQDAGVGRDWPISYDDLEPYYCRVEEQLGVAGQNDPSRQSPTEGSRPYPMDMVPWAYGDTRFAEVVNAYGYRSIPIPQARNSVRGTHRTLRPIQSVKSVHGAMRKSSTI
jgi:choline dehydrogenase-like flavoprotein